jgi:hypothetical protein
MIRIAALATMACLAVSTPAAAEVVSRSTDSFALWFGVPVEDGPEDIRATVAALPEWWDPAHTYTGDAANLSLDLEPGGCWCETLADGTTFQHGRVIFVAPDRVTLKAPLGPLNGKATLAELTIAVDHGSRRWIRVEFAVAGPGLGALADPVNEVMDGVFGRLIAYIETGRIAPNP